MPKISLKVNGREYAGWKTVRVTRGIKTICGSFDLGVSDKWSRSNPWPIREEDECELSMEGADEPVITGFIDNRTMESTDTDHALDVSGRDATSDLVDCSALLSKWEYRGLPLATLAKRLVEPFGLQVAIQGGIVLPAPPKKFTIDPGDTAFEVLERACRLVGLLAIADGNGGLTLMRPGAERATTALVEGENVKRIRASYDGAGRYRRYVVRGQHYGTDQYWEGTNRVSGEATDENVRRSHRVLLIRPEGAVTPALAKARAQWEATVRAARAHAVTITVQGWQQKDGSIWPVNARVPVKAPRHGIDGDMLISQATYSLDDQAGTLTELSLERPDAYRPEPVITTKSTELYFQKYTAPK